MSENKLPEGLKEERNQKISDVAACYEDLYADGYAEGIDDGVELFASYIAKQEPEAWKLCDRYIDNDAAAKSLIECHPDWEATPLYTHPSHLESENKRLRDALGRIAHISPETGRAGCTYGDTDFDSLSAVKGHNDLLEFVQKIATNALNK